MVFPGFGLRTVTARIIGKRVGVVRNAIARLKVNIIDDTPPVCEMDKPRSDIQSKKGVRVMGGLGEFGVMN
jgi:hypothetical protein